MASGQTFQAKRGLRRNAVSSVNDFDLQAGEGVGLAVRVHPAKDDAVGTRGGFSDFGEIRRFRRSEATRNSASYRTNSSNCSSEGDRLGKASTSFATTGNNAGTSLVIASQSMP